MIELFRTNRRSKPGRVPNLTIQRHVPLWLRMAGWAGLVLIGAAAAITIWQQTVGKGQAERESLLKGNQQLQAQLNQLEVEQRRLQQIADTAESQLQIERTAQQDLAAQLRNLEAENAKLKADLAYLESLLPAGQSVSAVSIRRFQVERDRIPNQWLVKALLIQADKNDKDFSGSVQIVISGNVGAKAVTQVWPETGNKESAAKARLAFKRTQRIEETIATPPDLVVKSMQLRILEQGSIRAQQQFNL